MEYFKRQIELWGEDTQNSLSSKHILIVGSGGLGCSLGYALASTGIGAITIIDFDTVSIHNIHRQIGFTLEDNGKYKVEALSEKLQKRYDKVDIKAIPTSFEEFVQKWDKTDIDIIVDATDNLPIREDIDKFAKSISIPWVYGSVEEFHGQVCFFDKASFTDSFVVNNHKPKGITTPIVMQIASYQANLVIRYLTDMPIQKDTLNYMFFDKFGEFQLQKFRLS